MKTGQLPGTAMRTLCAAATIWIAACGDDQGDDPGGPATTAGGHAAEPAAPVTPDHSTPESAVRTLIAACAAGDKAGVAACFSKASEGEFKPLVEQTADEETWADFFDFFKGAEVTGSEDGMVRVTLVDRDEEIELVEEDGAWKVVGF
jgi:hypothetical protein